ncbi:dephospho-CoA kinase [Lutibacter oceani]|uniref:Dephospho-CoA kinase n=1 Tax=Lutibacter oceani TaxID=1853311 RepID=A0A3D9RQ59_9FLAO|nr:dephospho-CoA kinase [Lutibacter oceani]REE82059.1 dephospho-CoA kinase [Lutibacter oceani]
MIIGLTGGIGSGKSTVLNMFKKLGFETYVADIKAKNLMNTNAALVQDITNLFGKEAYKNNELNKTYIAEIVFKDKKKLAALNALVHPKVREDFKNFVKKSPAKFIIYEAAILFESGSNKLCDFVITVTANLEDRIRRVKKRDGVTKSQVLDRIQHQLNDEEKIRKSHFVIVNNTLNTTEKQVLTVYNILLKHSKK